jgi:spermidine synthase
MIRFLSYIYPITKTVQSEHSGTLEITWINGKKHLNTKNANYSFGSLQTILKFGLRHINLKTCNSILILGLGGGSVIDTLKNDFNFDGHITAVEIDPVIIEIAKSEFNLSENHQLKIVCDDAVNFIKHNQKPFDLILVDLFIDTEVPSVFYSESFWQDIIKSNSKNGQILFNAALQSDSDNHLSEIIKNLESHNYQTQTLTKVNGTNTLLIAERNRL